jgi:hypothetical protein
VLEPRRDLRGARPQIAAQAQRRRVRGALQYWSHERRQHADPLRVGEPCWVSWAPADCILLTG